MFKAFTNNPQQNEIDCAQPMDTAEDSFVHIDNDATHPSLSLKVVPRHDTIGVDATKKTTEFCATITARDLPEDDSVRAPVDIIVVLDISGSMNGSKLDLCKTTLSLLLRELSSSDRFGLVCFGDEAKLVIPSRKLTPVHKDHALAKIRNLRTSGCTNLSGGIGMAAEEIKSIESPHEVQAIFLLTDGQANRGVCDRNGIVNLTKGCLGSSGDRGPIPIHCFGYGVDHDREMLRDISLATEGGTYYYVDNDSNVSSAFGDALGGVLSVVAQNTVVTLKVPEEASNNGVSILSVKHENAIKNDDGSYTVTLNDFYAEESRDIVFEVVLAKETNIDPTVHVSLSMKYLDTINSKLTQSDNVLGSISRPLGIEVSKSHPHVNLQCLRIKTTEVIAETERLADSGQFDTAKSTINSYIDELQRESATLEESSPFIAQMITELNTILTGLSSRTAYECHGSKYLQSRLMTHQMQRCSEAFEETPNSYKSSYKKARATRMKRASAAIHSNFSTK
jgi:hypothetical protein